MMENAEIDEINLKKGIFNICNSEEFIQSTISMFRWQAGNNPVYKEYLRLLNRPVESIREIHDISFLPIELFKQKIYAGKRPEELVFESSGTTSSIPSYHLVADSAIYKESFLKAFSLFYGSPDKYVILALLPSYLERSNSSLIYMMNELIKLSGHYESGFYLDNTKELVQKIEELNRSGKKYMLWGVTFALIELANQYDLNVGDNIVIETGGMKGRGPEMTRGELHEFLCRRFHTTAIHSEYGMTELLSQAYSKGSGVFYCPPWMKVLTRDLNDPFRITNTGKTGALNIIDLANIYSCPFIATQDLGTVHDDGSFEVLGRFDNSEIRGCNLMVSEELKTKSEK